VILAIGLAVHIAATVARANVDGHLPFASRFEALTFYGLVTAGLTLVIGISRRDLPVAFLILPLVIVFMVGALVGKAKAPHALPPVLNSPFFLIHVVLAFVGYGIYTLNLGLGIGALFARSATSGREDSGSQGLKESSRSHSNPGILDSSIPAHLARLGSVEELLGLVRKLVPWGLLTLGAGIALGGVWALFSWGTWWGWDPKETGALVTWMSYLVYVHSPVWKGRPRRAEAWLPLAAYLFLLLAFLGVNLLKGGLHAYQ